MIAPGVNECVVQPCRFEAEAPAPASFILAMFEPMAKRLVAQHAVREATCEMTLPIRSGDDLTFSLSITHTDAMTGQMNLRGLVIRSRVVCAHVQMKITGSRDGR